MSKIKLEHFKCYILVLLLLATNTTGFDIYFHAISVADFDLIDYYNPTWVVLGYELPRYIFFHYFLWLITIFGLLPLLPVLSILYAMGMIKAIRHRFKHGLIRHAVIAVMVVNIIFTSALGISLLIIGLGVLDVIENDSNSSTLICLGSVLHPIGFIVGFFLLLALRRWLYLLVLAAMISLSHSLTIFNSSNFVEYQRMIELSDLLVVNSFIYDKVVDKLSIEVFALFELLVIYLSFSIFSKIREIRILLSSFNRLISIVSVNYVIYFLLAVALIKSYPSHLTTGGPLAVLSFQYNELPKETLNIISAAWVSPFLLHDSIKSNQYIYRGDY